MLWTKVEWRYAEAPLRGDIMDTAEGAYRVISVRTLRKRLDSVLAKYEMSLVSESELEPGLRKRLEKTAERRGGKRTFPLVLRVPRRQDILQSFTLGGK